MSMTDLRSDWIRPDWPAPAHVQAVSTTRGGGVSDGVWRSLNLGTHVDDDPAHVAENRRLLTEALDLPAEPQWLNQVHGTRVHLDVSSDICADACVSESRDKVPVVMTADCLPVLLCDRSGTQVAAAHAGWRGLLAGVLEQTVAAFSALPQDLLVWLGPAIGPSAFEVGDEVRDAFVGAVRDDARFFSAHGVGHWLADLYGLATARLHRAGVPDVYGGGLCTYSDPARFFSYRREGVTGRMASLIWLTK